MRGRERTYFESLWNDFAADKTHSIPENDREAYAAAYARPGRMRAGWAYFVSFPQAAKDFEQLSKTKLTFPVLTIGGEKANGALLGQQLKLVATNVAVVVLKDTGHWLLEERPKEKPFVQAHVPRPAHTHGAGGPPAAHKGPKGPWKTTHGKPNRGQG